MDPRHHRSTCLSAVLGALLVCGCAREAPAPAPVAAPARAEPERSPAGGAGAFAPIGDEPRGAVRHHARTKPQSTGGVDGALRWFARHQDDDGCWHPTRFAEQCDGEPRCDPTLAADESSLETSPAATTGFAVLCFLGAGYDHRTPNRHRATVKRAVGWLLAHQAADGRLARRLDAHAIATMALAETYAMTADPALAQPAQRAVDVLLACQSRRVVDGREELLGWESAGPSDRSETRVSVWCVMALKSALAAQLQVGHGLDGAKRWLDEAWKADNPGWSALDVYHDASSFPDVYVGGAGTVEDAPPGEAPPLTAAAGDIAVFLGHHAGDLLLETLVRGVLRDGLPGAYPGDGYRIYFGTLAAFQCGGESWKSWNSTRRRTLLYGQRSGDACVAGSWDPQRTVFHRGPTDRLISTALGCLPLEVYYEYEVGGDRVQADNEAP